MDARDALDESGLSLEVDTDRVGRLTFDQRDSSVNILSREVMRSLDLTLSELESRIANGQLVVLVIRSGKEGSFIAGADVREIQALGSREEAAAASAEGQRIFRRLERLRVPTIAVIDGTCLGGGTELALHCDFRLASDRDSTRIGLPEVQLGIVPGFGGCVKLPRLCGIQNALTMILTGKPAKPRRARRMGLVDRVVRHVRLSEEVADFVADVLAGRVPPGGLRKGIVQRLAEETSAGRRILFRMVRRRTERQTKGFYPAPLRAIDVIERAYALPPDEAYAVESAALGETAVTDESRNLVRVFLLSQEAKKAVPERQLADCQRVGRAAVVGAGVMGGAIAELIAANDVPVVLKDIDQQALDAGLRHAGSLLHKAASAGVFSAEQAGLKLALITGTLSYDGFEDADIVIEAVVERMPVKIQVMREAEERVNGTAILATNTSSLSVTEMASAVRRPERVIGLHFFNPVHRMPLVEVVRTAHTSPEALAAGFGFALDLGKTPVIVADAAGFLVNRLLAPYLNEAGHLLEEGVGVAEIDAALTSFGLPMGPCRLLDEIGLDIALHASREMASGVGERLQPSGVIERMLDDGRLGKKNGRGFYLYEGGRSRSAGPALDRVLRPADTGGAHDGKVAAKEIRERCLHVMVNEAAYVLDEEVVGGADQVDLALVMGMGFPPFRGGLLRWADREGIRSIHRELVARRDAVGMRFSPAPLLERMAAKDQTFTHSP